VGVLCGVCVVCVCNIYSKWVSVLCVCVCRRTKSKALGPTRCLSDTSDTECVFLSNDFKKRKKTIKAF